MDTMQNITQIRMFLRKIMRDTSVSDVNNAFIALTLPIILRNIAAVIWPEHRLSLWTSVRVDFVVLILPACLLISVWHNYCVDFIAINIILTFAAASALYVTRWRGVFTSANFLEVPMKSRRPAITYYRAYLLIMTCFSILAVDFVIYPANFAKSGVYGIGVMDAGLGCFVFAHSVVSPEARGVATKARAAVAVWKSVVDSLPLLVAGLTRLALTKALDYDVAVQEYGLHWNFFFTLAAVKVLSTLVFTALPRRVWWSCGVVLIVAYQACLKWGLEKYVLFSSDGGGGREGLLDANREGIVSSIGYLALYLVGVQVGTVVTRPKEKLGDWARCTGHVIIMAVVTWCLYYTSEALIEPASRKFANITYLLWIMGVSTLMLADLMVIDIATMCVAHLETLKGIRVSGYTDEGCGRYDLISAIDYNGFLFFILGNLLTGVVNLSMDTRTVAAPVAYVITLGYMLILSATSIALKISNFSLKKYITPAEPKPVALFREPP